MYYPYKMPFYVNIYGHRCENGMLIFFWKHNRKYELKELFISSIKMDQTDPRVVASYI